MGSSARTATLVGLIASVSICSTTRADLIMPIEQDRQVSAFVIVPPCGGKDGAGDEAEGFGSYEGAVAAEIVCKDGFGVAAADQVSRIESAALAGIGSASSEAASEQHDVIHAISCTAYIVTFEVETEVDFAFEGVLSAGSANDPSLSAAHVRLTGPNDRVVFDHVVFPLPDGERRIEDIDEEGRLEPGVYRFRMVASAIIDNEVPPNLFAEAAFDFVLEIELPCPADLDDSGDVGFADLLAVLAAWGPCKGECTEDLDGSGSVDFAPRTVGAQPWYRVRDRSRAAGAARLRGSRAARRWRWTAPPAWPRGEG